MSAKPTATSKTTTKKRCTQCDTNARRLTVLLVGGMLLCGIALISMSLFTQPAAVKNDKKPAPAAEDVEVADTNKATALAAYRNINSRAWKEYMRGDYATAAADYRICLEMHEQQFGKDAVVIARDCRLLGENLAQLQGDSNQYEAERLFSRASKIFDNHPGAKPSAQYVALMWSYGYLTWAHGDVQNAQNYFQRGIEAFQSTADKARDHRLGVGLYKQMIDLCNKTGQTELANQYNEELGKLKFSEQDRERRKAELAQQREANAVASNVSGWTLPSLAAIALIVPVGCIFYGRRTARKYIAVNEKGLKVANRSCFCNSQLIKWQNVDRITVTEGKSKQSDSEEPGAACKVIVRSKNDQTIPIEWRDVIRCVEAGDFINSLKTWAPHALSECVFPIQQQWDQVDKSSYTQLWFKYYTGADDRQRTRLLSAGDTLAGGRYRIAGKLGSGGQGTAYLAVDTTSGAARKTADVVVKEYILPVHRGEAVLTRATNKLHLEAEILHKISHPQVVKVIDEFVEDYRGYLVMEHVTGTPLSDRVRLEGALSEQAVRQIALQVCDVLSYLHSMNPPLVHRDLTPNNLIMQENGLVKLIDFNVAHQLESDATATVVGKQCYIPPEQFRGKPTFQSDIYALGCTLFYLLAAEEPEPLSVSHPRSKNPAVSEQLDELIAKCTAIDARQRFLCTADVRAALFALPGEKLEENMVSSSERQKL